MTSGASYWPQSSASTAVLVMRGDYLPAATTFGMEVAKAGAALLLLYIGGIWLSSGYHANNPAQKKPRVKHSTHGMVQAIATLGEMHFTAIR